MLDEQSFQGLLAAAFTIQQHNDRRKNDTQPASVAATLPAQADEAPSRAEAPENLRPGERLQRNWASMWMMSQEQGLGPMERDQALLDAPPPRFSVNGHDPADTRVTAFSPEIELSAETPEHSELAFAAFSGVDDPAYNEAEPNEAGHNEIEYNAPGAMDTKAIAAGTLPNLMGRFLDFRVKLRFHRADLYLGIAILIAVLALLWPATASQRPKLHPWERILIAMGVAEAPPPAVHYRGDPSVKVWVDTHTALYYCAGEELYGKSPDGHFSTQREAQLDRFEPAERSACVE
jgi:hypothetical protein